MRRSFILIENMKKLIIFFTFVLGVQSAIAQLPAAFATNDYVRALKHATDVMVTDVTSPVAAARYYAYITLSANETFALFDKEQPRFANAIKDLKPITAKESLINRSEQSLAVILALYKTGIRFLPSGYMLKKNVDSLLAVAKKKKTPEHKIKSTLELVDSVVSYIGRYSSSDGFAKLSGYRRFTPRRGDAYWQPTAPGFMAAIEPYWHTLRTFIIDSCSQFNGPAPAVYDTSATSSFYRQVKEVYDITSKLSKEESEIAMFWDCNPFALQQVGHLEFGIKKISPGGHWMGITGIASRKQKLNLGQTAYAHAIVALGLSDAFVACWNVKYKFIRVRPVTAIKKLIDRSWNPLLQTPPFPEYTSGHSVISTTAATILTHLFGQKFSFVDDSEVEFGLPSRKFESFRQACSEAAISRLYGGIHFRDAIEDGVKEGEKIGNYVVLKSSTIARTSSSSAMYTLP